MNSFQLKILAIVSMIVDHTCFVFFPQYTIFRIFGRLAFPLFAFSISYGFTKTSNVRNYLVRLLAFAAISQIPYVLMIRAGGGIGLQLNIFFTLSFGLIGLILIDKYKDIYSRFFIILILFYISNYFRFEYGVYGISLILASYLFIKNQKLGVISVILISILNVIYRIIYLGTYLQIFALVALPLMLFYNGERGLDKYKNWFYYIYPVHMLVLAFMAYLIK